MSQVQVYIYKTNANLKIVIAEKSSINQSINESINRQSPTDPDHHSHRSLLHFRHRSSHCRVNVKAIN